MKNTPQIHLPSWAAALPSQYFNLSEPAAAAAFREWVYNSAYSCFQELQAAVGPDNVPGAGDGTGQLEDLTERAPQLFDFAGEASALVSDPTRALQLAIGACDEAITDLLETCEPEAVEAE